MKVLFTVLLLALKLTNVSQAFNDEFFFGNGEDEQYDEPLDFENPIMKLLRKQPNNIVHFEAAHSNHGVNLILIVANPDLQSNLTVGVLVHKKLKFSQDTKVFDTKEFIQINAVSCGGVTHDEEVNEVTCRHSIQIQECADLFFMLEETGMNASARAISVSPGSVMLKQTINETLLRWNIPCDVHLTAPIHFAIGDQETKKKTRFNLEGLCSDTKCVSNIQETKIDFSFQPCSVYDLTVDGYSENIVPFLHWSTAHHAKTGNVIGKYSNQTLLLTVTFGTKIKTCNENLRAVNVTSPRGAFQPQAIRCLSEKGYSTKRCSETVRITTEKLVCQPRITVNVLPIYGRNDEASYAIEGGSVDLPVVIITEPKWDGGKSVVGLEVNVDQEDIAIEWDDPFCPVEGLDSFNLTLTAGPLNSTNGFELTIPTKCSRWEMHNRVLIVNGVRLKCRAENYPELTTLSNDIKLLSCANYSLSIAPSSLRVPKSISFVSPFQPQDITNVISKATQNGFELQWSMPENCPVSTEVDIEVSNISYKIRPFDHSGSGVITTDCHAQICVVSWKVAQNLIPCNEYSIRIGSAYSILTIPPSAEDFKGATLVSILKNHPLRVEFVIDAIQKRCLPYLHALEVIFRQPYEKRAYSWVPSCSKSRDTDDKISCSEEVPFGYINVCHNHSISYRPRFSLSSETTTVWNNENIPPFANSSKLLGGRVMRVQSEHRNHISVKWKSPSCLFGHVARWNLSIETHEKTNLYSAEIPSNCSMINNALNNEDHGYNYSIQIRNNVTECHNGAPHFVNKLELASCSIYRIKLWPIVKISHEKYLLVKQFHLHETVSTDVDFNDVQDVRVVDVAPRSFNTELIVPARCSRFKVKMRLIANGKVTSMDQFELADCKDGNCTLMLRNPIKSVPYTHYNVSIGHRSVEFTTSLEDDERIPRNVTETELNEITCRIQWSVVPDLKDFLVRWQILVTDAKSGKDIFNENLSANQTTFDILIPHPNISAVDQEDNELQKCPVLLYRLGAVWSGEIGNETSRTFWTESRILNYTSCHMIISNLRFSMAREYIASDGFLRNVTEIVINEDMFRIKWSVSPLVKKLLAGWRIRVTDSKSRNVIIDKQVPASETSFDIFIPYANVSAVDKAMNKESQKCQELAYQLGAIWPGMTGNKTSRTLWAEIKTLNYTGCDVISNSQEFSIEKDYVASERIISLQLLIILCVSGGALLLLIGVVIYVRYARKKGTWHVEN